MFDNPQILGATAGLITASLAVATFVANWLTSRRDVNELKAHVAHDTAVAGFWSEWLKLQKETCDGEALEAAKACARAAADRLPTFPQRELDLRRRSSLGAALLLYAPSRRRAWVPRVFFWTLTVVSATMLITLPFTLDDEAFTNFATLVFGLALAGLALLFRTLSLKLETRP